MTNALVVLYNITISLIDIIIACKYYINYRCRLYNTYVVYILYSYSSYLFPSKETPKKYGHTTYTQQKHTHTNTQHTHTLARASYLYRGLAADITDFEGKSNIRPTRLGIIVGI